MDGADADRRTARRSAVAADWSELWGGFAGPAWHAVVTATGIGPGSRVLDVGCGSGELLDYLGRLGASPAGVDPAPGMVELARSRVPAADVRPGTFEHRPWPDGSFDVVTAFNALQFADDTLDALAECTRVARPGGHVAVANWAGGARHQLHSRQEAGEPDRPPPATSPPPGRLGGGASQWQHLGLQCLEPLAVPTAMPSSPDGGVGLIDRRPPDPGVGRVVAPDPLPAHRRPGERLLYGVLGVGQAPGHGVQLDDQPPVVAGVELIEVALGQCAPRRSAAVPSMTQPRPGPGSPSQPT